MKQLKQDLQKIVALKRRRHHPLVHAVHKAYGISRKTLFYVKEYGSHSNVPRTIIKESLKILLLASIISLAGGTAIEQIKLMFVAMIPLIILLPALNDMIGDYGSIVSSRVATMLHEGKIRGNWHKNKEIRKLFNQILFVAVTMAVLSAGASLLLAHLSGFDSSISVSIKVFVIAIVDVALLVTLLSSIAVTAGIYYFRKKEDPNNMLIPITTSVADFANMIILSVLFLVLF